MKKEWIKKIAEEDLEYMLSKAFEKPKDRRRKEGKKQKRKKGEMNTYIDPDIDLLE